MENSLEHKNTIKPCEMKTRETASSAFEQILKRVGDFNQYQWRLAIICALCALISGIQDMAAVFLAASPDHMCAHVQDLNESYSLPSQQNEVVEESYSPNTCSFHDSAVSWTHCRDGEIVASKCNYFEYSNTSVSGLEYDSMDLANVTFTSAIEEKSCNSWRYDDSVFTSTVVTEWDLVCRNRWKMSLTQSTYLMGTLLGTLVFSWISDGIGRRISTLISGCLATVCAISTAFVSSYPLFLILRLIAGGAGAGLFTSVYVLMMETVNSKGRNILVNLTQLAFPVGGFTVSLCSYLFRDWRKLQLVTSVPAAAFLVCFWILPESPRWLLMRGREDEAINYLKDIAKSNGKPCPTAKELSPFLSVIASEIEKPPDHETNAMEKLKSSWRSVAVLFKTRNMRKRNLIMLFVWFATLMGIFGLPFSGESISASLHATVAASEVLGFVAVIILIFVLTRIGRKPFMCTSFILAGFACVSIALIPKEMVWVNLFLVSFGYASFSCTYSLACMFSTELAPTPVRNTSFGVASSLGRIGGMSTPFIVNLIGEIYYAIPTTIFGVMALLAGLLTLLLPETGNKQLPETVEEIEAMPR